jgi:replication initiation and membrane attachment protein DnaB
LKHDFLERYRVVSPRILFAPWVVSPSFINSALRNFGLLLSKISSETFLVKFTKNHKRTVKSFFFGTNAKVHEMTKMLYKCANNLFFNELRRMNYFFFAYK